jgi:hypothetical protein
MIVRDKVFEKHWYDSAVENVFRNDFQWHHSRSDNGVDNYLTHDNYGSLYDRDNPRERINEWKDKYAKEAWEYLTNDYMKLPSGAELDSSYYNGIKFGDSSDPHIDSTEEKFTTIIVYLCNRWNICWGGETSFFSGVWNPDLGSETFFNSDIIMSVIPKPNRIVVFDGKLMHAVRPLNKIFHGIRPTLMFKIKGVLPDEIEFN